LRDPEGANLDRIQVIKLSVQAGDEPSVQETIFDVAASGGRSADASGRVTQAVGNTVDVENATYTNAIGAGSLSAVWQDPDFDPNEPALYYARVLEIPTPRWTTYDAARFGTPLPEEAPVTLQQRAYTSPIWYTPPAE
jgi:hypothetical protein